jgi:hypothetical protein
MTPGPRQQNAFGSRATYLRLVRYAYFGTYATLPSHEGDERGARLIAIAMLAARLMITTILTCVRDDYNDAHMR